MPQDSNAQQSPMGAYFHYTERLEQYEGMRGWYASRGVKAADAGDSFSGAMVADLSAENDGLIVEAQAKRAEMLADAIEQARFRAASEKIALGGLRRMMMKTPLEEPKLRDFRNRFRDERHIIPISKAGDPDGMSLPHPLPGEKKSPRKDSMNSFSNQ